MQRDLEAIEKIANYLDNGNNASNEKEKLLKIASTALRETSEILEKTALENKMLKEKIAALEQEKNAEIKTKRINGIIEDMIRLSVIKRQDKDRKFQELYGYDNEALETLEKTLKIIPTNKEDGLEDLNLICQNNRIKENTKTSLEESINKCASLLNT